MRLRRLEPALRRALTGPCRVARGDRVLVAVSGGADSVGLLLGLQALAPRVGLSLHAAHLNHGLRGGGSDGDQAFVAALCARLGVPLAAERWDCRARMRRRGLSGQAGLRTLRHEFLTAAARRAGAHRIATAHTADDQLETLLLRLTRGAGGAGLAGMTWRRGAWIKPLLGVSRGEIEADLEAHREPWREDPSNADLRYARSRVRHLVIPALVRVADPRADGESRADRARTGLARRVASAMAELHDAQRLLARRGARIFARVSRIHPGEIALDSKALATYPSLIQRIVLRLLWQRPGRDGTDLSHRHLNALQSLVATSRGGSRVDLPDGWRAVRDRGQIVIRRSGGFPGPRRARGAAGRSIRSRGSPGPDAGSGRRAEYPVGGRPGPSPEPSGSTRRRHDREPLA